MADDKNQQPEESFKDKILRSLHEQDDSTFTQGQRMPDNGQNLHQSADSGHTPQQTPEIDHSWDRPREDTQSVNRSDENTELHTSNQPLHDDFNFDRNVQNDFDHGHFYDDDPGVLPPEEQSGPSDMNGSGNANEQEWPASIGSRSENNHGIAQAAPVQSEPQPQVQQPEPEEKNKKRAARKKEDKIVSKIVLIVISTLVVIGAILIFSVYSYVQSSLKPLDSDDSQLVQVEIPSGSSNKMIGEILEKKDIIKSGIVFNFYTKFNNQTNFQSGYYQMSPDMTLDDICKLLQDGGTAEPVDIADAKITIPEGYDVSQIASQIEKATDSGIKADDFKALMANEDFFNKMKEKFPQLLTSAGEAQGVRYRLEGYLFPATYDFYNKTSSIESLTEQMVAKTDSVLSGYYEEIQNHGYTVHQALTLASLVEKEGIENDDRRNIAQVFINRLNASMPLQSDISILYALDTHKETVTYEDLEVDSPYNLYKNKGYGPGPFNSPSEDSLQAVLNPTENNYLYFVADVSTGKVYFAETYEEHEELVEKYVNN